MVKWKRLTLLNVDSDMDTNSDMGMNRSKLGIEIYKLCFLSQD